jgi:hypothetical protein
VAFTYHRLNIGILCMGIRRITPAFPQSFLDYSHAEKRGGLAIACLSGLTDTGVPPPYGVIR